MKQCRSFAAFAGVAVASTRMLVVRASLPHWGATVNAVPSRERAPARSKAALRNPCFLRTKAPSHTNALARTRALARQAFVPIAHAPQTRGFGAGRSFPYGDASSGGITIAGTQVHAGAVPVPGSRVDAFTQVAQQPVTLANTAPGRWLCRPACDSVAVPLQ